MLFMLTPDDGGALLAPQVKDDAARGLPHDFPHGMTDYGSA